MSQEKNIQVYLPDGNPLGIRLLDLESLGVVG